MTQGRHGPNLEIEKAWERGPVTGPGALSDLVGPSYLFAILTDVRIANESLRR